jgi:hypothetical protein
MNKKFHKQFEISLKSLSKQKNFIEEIFSKNQNIFHSFVEQTFTTQSEK